MTRTLLEQLRRDDDEEKAQVFTIYLVKQGEQLILDYSYYVQLYFNQRYIL